MTLPVSCRELRYFYLHTLVSLLCVIYGEALGINVRIQ